MEWSSSTWDEVVEEGSLLTDDLGFTLDEAPIIGTDRAIAKLRMEPV